MADSSAGAHMPGLDGLRGVLILCIMSYHLGYGSGLFVSVDTFFLLSGFLITSLLLQKTPVSFVDLRAWWARRARRLIPAVAVLTTCVLLVFSDRRGVAWDGVATMTWWENWRQAFGATNYWSPRPSPLRHAWTLSIEEQFYFLWPLCVMGVAALARKTKISISTAVATLATILAAASFLWAAWLAQTGVSPNRIYLGTDTRVGSLLLGCALGAVFGRFSAQHSRKIWGVQLGDLLGVLGIGTIAALAATVSIEDPTTYSGGLALGTLGSLLVVGALARPGFLTRVLSIAPMQWLGVRSYGIYLWAWPAQVFLEQQVPKMARPLVVLCTVAISFVAGDLSLRFIEMPLRGRNQWAAKPLARELGWRGGAVVLVATTLVVGFSERPLQVYEEVSAEESARIALADVAASQTEDRLDSENSSTLPDLSSSTPPSSEPALADPGAPAPVPPVPAPAIPVQSAPDPATPVPAAPATPIQPSAAPLPPMRVMTAGDSQAFNAAHPKLRRSELPKEIESVTVAGVLGCGILVRAPGWTLYDPARGGLVPGEYCVDTAEVAEVEALKAKPDWMVLFSGGFERPFGYRNPAGEILPARDPAIRAAVVERLLYRVNRAHDAGVRTALVAWACMGIEVGNKELEVATRWHNAILEEVAAAIPGTIVIWPTAEVCIDANPYGAPTPEKEKAWGNEVHPVDRAWLWKVQLGPVLVANR